MTAAENLLILPRFLPVGDSALSVEFGNAISPPINNAVVSLDIALLAAELEGIVETVPSFRSLLICYDPGVLSHERLVETVRRLIRPGGRKHEAAGVPWNVPVVYDPPYADDLDDVAQRLGLAPEQVIALHAGAEYRVYMVGFAPGIPIMGGLPEPLHIPRRLDPRGKLPAGAVVIGGMQAAIASAPVPSGWYILGRTPLRLFDLSRADPFLFRPGDRIRFRRIDIAEYQRLAELSSAHLHELSRAA
jgi:KipI family sensor histidine kinase inhibitor